MRLATGTSNSIYLSDISLAQAGNTCRHGLIRPVPVVTFLSFLFQPGLHGMCFENYFFQLLVMFVHSAKVQISNPEVQVLF